MQKMKEAEFYNMCDIVESFNDVTGGYYPTVEELEAHNIGDQTNVYLPLIAYFASDPLKREGKLDAAEPDYQDTVSFCKELLCKVELTPEEN